MVANSDSKGGSIGSIFLSADSGVRQSWVRYRQAKSRQKENDGEGGVPDRVAASAKRPEAWQDEKPAATLFIHTSGAAPLSLSPSRK